MANFKRLLKLSDQVLGTVLLAVRDNLLDVAISLVCQQANRSLNAAVAPVLRSQGIPATPWASDRLAARTVDGLMLESNLGWQKLAIPKGLPTPGTNEKRLAVVNPPHQVDDYSGIIPEGYGAGRKTLLLADTVMVKIKGKSSLQRINYHEHDAKVAGLHNDLVITGIPDGTDKFEFHIFRGEFRGRYAVTKTDRGMIIVNMKDNGQQFAKPKTSLKDVAYLESIEADRASYNVTRKVDGSSSSATISNNRTAFRGHRDESQTYYDRLPSLEFVDNKSSYFSCRQLFRGPDQEGTKLIGELAHADGASRQGGILNAHPDKSQAIQRLQGESEFYAWDIEKLRGKDVSHLPQWKRHELYRQVIQDIRRFNKSYHCVEECPADMTFADYYEHVLTSPLPWGEGVVVKHKYSVDRSWLKVKRSENADLKVVAILAGGPGKYANSMGSMVVEGPTGEQGRVGSFNLTDSQRQWIYDHKDMLEGQIAEIEVFEMSPERQVPRAGRFQRFHPDKSEAGLLLYAESLAGGDQQEMMRTKYTN